VAGWKYDEQKTLAYLFEECKNLLVQLACELMDEELGNEMHESLKIPVVSSQTVEAVLKNEGVKMK
jgi:hypothetical protein